MKVDSLFPVAVVVALALGGAYRVAHRRLQPSAFLELRDLSFGVGCGCVLALAIGSFLHGAFGMPEPYATQLVMAVIVAIGVITVGRIVLRFFLRTADHDPGARRRFGHDGRSRHARASVRSPP